MCARMVPVWRGDGASYPSCMAAARALAGEWGLHAGRGRLAGMASEIGKAARSSHGRRTAYGHMWNDRDVLADRATAEGLLARVRELEAGAAALEDALGAMRARLENANDRLREAGLEQA